MDKKVFIIGLDNQQSLFEMKKSTSISNRMGKCVSISSPVSRSAGPTPRLGYKVASKATVTQSRVRSEQIQRAIKDATSSPEAAREFLRAAGILTVKGNLSPKYK